MLFQSFEFLLLCPLVVLVYFLLPVRSRWIWILLASYGFYMYWNPWYIFILLASTITDYTAGIMLAPSEESRYRKLWLYLSVLVNLGLLATFKYFNFFAESFAWVVRAFNPDYQPYLLDLLLPIGISFYTFQTLGYTIDVYRGKQEPVRHFGRFAVYVAFFPQLVAGPIERAKDLLPQLHFNYDFLPRRVVEGLRIFLWGMFKKMVIADRIGLYVGMVYASPEGYSGLIIYVAALLFCFQIYYDFSAYQDMAVGVAQVLGIRLSKNFDNMVLFKSSCQKFWQGWHITLTNWIRDYVYRPMVGRSRSTSRFLLSLLFLFFLIGLWHGASWTFVLWGTLQGVFIIIERYLRPLTRAIRKRYGKRVMNFLGWAGMINVFAISLLLFRPGDLATSWSMIEKVLSLPFTIDSLNINPGLATAKILLTFILLGLTILFEYTRMHVDGRHILNFEKPWQRWVAYFVLAFAIIYLQIPEQSQFIYFEF